VILLLDACRTEGGKDNGIGIGDRQPGTITIYSCERNQPAYEIDELRHGAFTAALLEGLAMPKSDKNCATVQRLDQHLRDRVPQLCLKHPEKPTQKPSTTVDPGQKWYFLLLPKVATEQDIAALKSEARGAELDEDWDLAEQLWIRFGAVAPGDRSAFEGFARVQRKKDDRSSIPPQSPRQPSSSIEVRSKSDRQPTTKPIEPSTVSRSPLFVLPLHLPQPPKPASKPVKPSLPTFNFHSVTLDATGKQIARQPGTATYFTEDLGNGITLDMVQIPGGTFKMGSSEGEKMASDDEFPQHTVTVKEFWMGKFAITQEQWKTIARQPQIKTDLKEDPSNFKGAKLPIEQVTWQQAKEFCDRLSKKTGRTFDLPTEAQWEYACRAGTTTPFHFGPTITTDVANFDGNSTYAKASKGTYRKETIVVDSFDPNAFGLYNMHGNVWEWCLDDWHGNYEGAPSDDRAWTNASNDSGSNSKVVRGGSWIDDPRYCRSASRYYIRSGNLSGDIGFRVISPIPSPRT
jgi:formylglycine-generating enzyme required for sulfatase activity